MSIGTESVDGALVALVRGRIDSANKAAEFQGVLLDAVGAHEGPVIVDCQGLDYLASMGLRVILIGARLMAVRNAPFAVCSLSGSVAEVFNISGFDRVIQTFHSREEALAAIVG